MQAAYQVHDSAVARVQVWPGSVHYPDFFSPVTAAYWETELRAFHALAEYDGARPLPTASIGSVGGPASSAAWSSHVLGLACDALGKASAGYGCRLFMASL